MTELMNKRLEDILADTTAASAKETKENQKKALIAAFIKEHNEWNASYFNPDFKVREEIEQFIAVLQKEFNRIYQWKV